MQAHEGGHEHGLVYGFVVDGDGAARRIHRPELELLDLYPQDALWLHWDRSVAEARGWLRESSGLNEFACNLLLEEATRPRLVPLGSGRLLLFLRGVNLNPGAAPEDMVALRIYVDAQRVISLRLRPVKAAGALCDAFEVGDGPRSVSDIMLAVEEPLKVTRCTSGGAGCVRGERCLTHDLWTALGRQIESFLGAVSLQDVLDGRLDGAPRLEAAAA